MIKKQQLIHLALSFLLWIVFYILRGIEGRMGNLSYAAFAAAFILPPILTPLIMRIIGSKR